MTNVRTRLAFRVLVCAVALAGGAALFSPIARADLDIGDFAPDFELQGSDGSVHRLADYRGRAVVIAWFPKAFTGG